MLLVIGALLVLGAPQTPSADDHWLAGDGTRGPWLHLPLAGGSWIACERSCVTLRSTIDRC